VRRNQKQPNKATVFTCKISLKDADLYLRRKTSQNFKMSALDVLMECAEIQKKLFFNSFLSGNKLGEITCVNGVDNEDSYMFERFEVHGKGIVVVFRLLCEDTLISENISFSYIGIESFIAEKNKEMRNRYEIFLERLAIEGKTLQEAKQEMMSQGGDPTTLDFKEFSRDLLEDTLHPGRKRINGDRNTRLQIMHRQSEIPSDLQRPRLNVFELPMPTELLDYLVAVSEDARIKWEEDNLDASPRYAELACKLPFLRKVTDVFPRIYEFPDKELDVERELGRK